MMHDLDPTLLETADNELWNETDPSAEMQYDAQEQAYEDESLESDNEDQFYEALDETADEMADNETGLDEAEVLELATQALEIRDEQEMEYFLGGLFKKVAKRAGGALRGPLGSSLMGIMKNAARKALPIAASAVGGMVGGPFGAAIGNKLSSQAGQVLGLELEGLSTEDQEFETARQFVRFAGTAAKSAMHNAMSGVSPMDAAKHAVTTAASRYAPGLLRRAGCSDGSCKRGHWVRRGNTIVIYGV